MVARQISAYPKRAIDDRPYEYGFFSREKSSTLFAQSKTNRKVFGLPFCFCKALRTVEDAGPYKYGFFFRKIFEHVVRTEQNELKVFGPTFLQKGGNFFYKKSRLMDDAHQAVALSKFRSRV